MRQQPKLPKGAVQLSGDKIMEKMRENCGSVMQENATLRAMMEAKDDRIEELEKRLEEYEPQDPSAYAQINKEQSVN